MFTNQVLSLYKQCFFRYVQFCKLLTITYDTGTGSKVYTFYFVYT